jgi:hypothetical protein
MSDMFEFRVQARNPAGYLFLAFATLCAGLAMAGRLPHVVAPLALVVMAALALRLVLNPASGFRICSSRIEIFRPGFVRVIPIGQVDSILITGLGRGSTLARLRLMNGSCHELPAVERLGGKLLAAALRERGLRVLI